MSTKIEWADETWNPIVGCRKISEGCQNCYDGK
jgi:protein gp37